MRSYTELEVALEIEKLVRLYEVTAVNKPELKPGLACAVGLSQLWSQKFAPGHDAHPYPNFGMALKDIPGKAVKGEIELSKPKPVENNRQEGRYKTTSPVNPAKMSPDVSLIYNEIMAQTMEFGYAMIREKVPAVISPEQIRSVIGRLVKYGSIKRISEGKYEVTK